MPNTNNTCRLVAQNIAALSAVAAGDVHRLSYTGTDGIALHVRARNIGGDPHNFSIYEKLGMCPKDAFDHAARAFGYEPTNRNTAGVKKGIASGTWGTCATPHWAEGDFPAAHRLLMSLAALTTVGRTYTPQPTVFDAAKAILDKLDDVPATCRDGAINDIALVLSKHKPGFKLANGGSYIGGLGYRVGGYAGGQHLAAICGCDNYGILEAAGIPASAKDTVVKVLNGAPVGTGDFPPCSNISLVIAHLIRLAADFPLRGVLSISGLTHDQRIIVSGLISKSDGSYFGASLGRRNTAGAALTAQVATLAVRA